MKPSHKELLVHDIKIKVFRKKIKNLYLKFCTQKGEFSLAAPNHFNDQFLNAFVMNKMDWIKQRQIDFQKKPQKQTQAFVSHEVHEFMGKGYRLTVIEGIKPSRVYLQKDNIVMEVPHGATKEMKEKLLHHWYRKNLQALIPGIIAHWEPIVQQKVFEWGIKNMKTRWGTCNPSARRIWLNLMLAKKPIACLEYVVLHEMVHLIEQSHNHVFKACMDKFMPEWRINKAKLQ